MSNDNPANEDKKNPDCKWPTEEELKKNRRLSFQQFDQQGAMPIPGTSIMEPPASPTTFRAYENQGCPEQAAFVTEDYFTHVPMSQERWKFMNFHAMQSWAKIDKKRAVPYAEAAMPSRTKEYETTYQYFLGALSFLKEDKAGIDKAIVDLDAALSEAMVRCNAPQVSSQEKLDCAEITKLEAEYNLDILRSFQLCPEKSWHDALNLPECQPKKPPGKGR